MTYSVSPKTDDSSILIKTTTKSKKARPGDWWNSDSKKEMCERMLATVGFLRESHLHRYRQASLFARIYGNIPLSGWAGTNFARMDRPSFNLPLDRPTMSVVTSTIDTLVSKLTQSRPRPVFLTDGADYKKRNLAEQMNHFINGELYQTDAYQLGSKILRDACVFGTGVIKVLQDQENKVCLERRIFTELLSDSNDSYYGQPRSIYELKLMDRQVLMSMFPKYRSLIERAESAFPSPQEDNDKTISDLVMTVEAWHLRSGPEETDGVHLIACTEGILLDETYEKDEFPFVFLNYSDRLVGMWGQGLAERLMGTQMEINKLLMTITKSINLVGVPRVFIEDGSKIVKAHLNNEIGAIVTYRGTKPIYEVAPCMPAEIYGQLQRLIDYAYQEAGLSQLAASAQKPAGLNSGIALREYDDIQTDRFASLAKTYDEMYICLAYKIIDQAKDIAKKEGKYQTVYPSKDGTQEVDLPNADLLNDSFVIQCYDASSLPRDSAGRLQTVTEWMQAGIVSPQEGRRLLDLPDLQQFNKLENAAEERILKILDQIVEEGKYTPPDPFMDLMLANKLVVQYYNLYLQKKLPESKAQLLRDFFSQLQTLKQQATPPPPPTPQMANPSPLPQSDLLSNVKSP